MINVYMDDLREGPHNSIFEHDLTEGWENWIIVRSVENVKRLLELGVVHHLALDHDMGCTSDGGSNKELPSGSHLVKWMIESNVWPDGEISVHSGNFYKAKQMKEDIEAARSGTVIFSAQD